MTLVKGDRVQVLGHWNWPNACTGRVAEAPGGIRALADGNGAWQGCRRVVQGRRRSIEFQWIVFDQPQLDGDGDGPYLAGEVETEYLRPVEE